MRQGKAQAEREWGGEQSKNQEVYVYDTRGEIRRETNS